MSRPISNSLFLLPQSVFGPIWIGFSLSAAIFFTGCAGKWPFSKSSDGAIPKSPFSLGSDDLPTASTSSTSSWEKATAKLHDALTPEPKVIPPPDPTSLTSKTGPVGPQLFVSAARVFESQENQDAAAAQYEKALKSDPKHLAALVHYARLEDRRGNFGKAVALYQQAIENHPQNPMAHNDLALCYARKGDTKMSIQSFSRAVELAPQKKIYRNNLAKVLVENSQTDAAMQHLAKVHEPKIAHYNLGYMLVEANRTAQAQEHLRRALAMDPSFQPAQQLVQEIYRRAAASPVQKPNVVAVRPNVAGGFSAQISHVATTNQDRKANLTVERMPPINRTSAIMPAPSASGPPTTPFGNAAKYPVSSTGQNLDTPPSPEDVPALRASPLSVEPLPPIE